MRTACGDLRRLAHGRDRDVAGPSAAALLQRLLSNDVDKIAVRRRAVQRAVPRGRRRARRPLHLPARRRPLPDRHERRQPRARPRVVPASTRRTSTPTSATALADWAMLAVQGPQARGIVAGARRRRRCPTRFARRDAAARRHEALVCGTGYTGEDGVEMLLPAADGAGAIWDALARPAAPCRPGSARATRCAWRSATTSTATTSMESRGPIEAGLGWCCKEDTGFIGAEAVAAAREAGPAEKLVAVHDRRRRDRAPGQPDRRRRRGHERHDVAVARRRHRHGLRAGRRAPRARDSRSTSAARAPRRGRAKPLYSRRGRASRPWPTRAIPTTCSTTPSTTGRGSTATSRTFGITWHAQDALGEVVFFDPPAVGRP